MNRFHATTPLHSEHLQVLPIQMATGYSAFANGGYRIQPHFINRIEDAWQDHLSGTTLNMHVSVVSQQESKPQSAWTPSRLMMK